MSDEFTTWEEDQAALDALAAEAERGYERITARSYYPQVDRELGPPGTEEMPVAQLLREVHRIACVAGPAVPISEVARGAHSALCNTARLLAQDQAHLAVIAGRQR